mmetsp:Transcript_25736/g.51386  ORF Transcript_25736/g.51386 Transcript_25736/m.51386 type:complete len:415 (-) Transcript_25736:63-1307(-)
MGSEISRCVEDMTGSLELDICEQANKDEGEVAAGFLYQRPSRSKLATMKSTATGSNSRMKRSWYVLRGWPDCTLTTYKDRFSPAPNGVIHLLKCDVKAKPAEDDKFHFQVHHSSHGSRHLFAESNSEMNRWIAEIMNVIEEASAMGGMEGNLKKRGGIRLHTWQSRWFMLMGTELAWYEKPTDSFPRGHIVLGPQVTAAACDKSIGGEKCVFEIIDAARHDSKRRREFACETTLDRKYWVEAITKSIKSQQRLNRERTLSSQLSRAASMREEGEGEGGENGEEDEAGFSVSNFLKNTFGGNEDMDDGIHFPDAKEGPMQKHSSYLVWQTKYFQCVDGELRYWKSQASKEKGNKESAKIYLGEIQQGSPSINPIDHTGIYIATDTKIYSLRCESEQEAKEWLDNIAEWMRFAGMQ